MFPQGKEKNWKQKIDEYLTQLFGIWTEKIESKTFLLDMSVEKAEQNEKVGREKLLKRWQWLKLFGSLQNENCAFWINKYRDYTYKWLGTWNFMLFWPYLRISAKYKRINKISEAESCIHKI